MNSQVDPEMYDVARSVLDSLDGVSLDQVNDLVWNGLIRDFDLKPWSKLKRIGTNMCRYYPMLVIICRMLESNSGNDLIANLIYHKNTLNEIMFEVWNQWFNGDY